METRSAILHSACLLFSQRGYDAVGVQELVDAVGVAKPSLYHHFGSKQGVLEALLAMYLKPFNLKLAERCVYHQDIVLSLEGVARTFFEFAQLEPLFFRLWMTMRLAPAQSVPFEALSPYTQVQQQLLSTLFANAALQHGNLRDKQDMLALSFSGLLYIYATQAIQTRRKMDETMVYRIVHQFMYGIFS
jgi:TetR/AcrR family transcriptional regulator